MIYARGSTRPAFLKIFPSLEGSANNSPKKTGRHSARTSTAPTAGRGKNGSRTLQIVSADINEKKNKTKKATEERKRKRKMKVDDMLDVFVLPRRFEVVRALVNLLVFIQHATPVFSTSKIKLGYAMRVQTSRMMMFSCLFVYNKASLIIREHLKAHLNHHA